MRQTFAGLLVLLASLGLMALAPASLELARLPPGQSAGGPPRVPDWRALAGAPGPAQPAGPPQMALGAADAVPELDHFAECMRSGTAPSPSGEDGRRALALADAAVESLATGRLARPAI